MSKTRLATTWLDGCSGCHMSFLDIDERIIEVAGKVAIVFSPLVDFKEYPEEVDVALVEGAVSSEDDLEKIRLIRKRTKFLIAFGDCAVNGNVPAMRNTFPAEVILKRAYVENASAQPGAPTDEVPVLLAKSRPIHEHVKVDFYLPGCPPSAELIYYVLGELLEGRVPDLAGKCKFG